MINELFNVRVATKVGSIHHQHEYAIYEINKIV